MQWPTVQLCASVEECDAFKWQALVANSAGGKKKYTFYMTHFIKVPSFQVCKQLVN